MCCKPPHEDVIDVIAGQLEADPEEEGVGLLRTSARQGERDICGNGALLWSRLFRPNGGRQ
jgi:hypothetical protein